MRKTKTVVIDREGRDKGKHFLITEMPAAHAEKWAARAFLALAHAGIEVPEEMQGAGMAGIAIVGLRALGRVSWVEAEPLMDEMMACVQAIPDPQRPAIIRPLMADGDIEEVATRMRLRAEVFELHTGFSLAAAISGSPAAEDPTTSPPTRTFLKSLVR